MDNDRRKLLLGSAAVPLILTVRPAAAHANKSIAVCMEKDRNKPKPHRILESKDHPDQWMRKRVDVYELARWDNDKKKWKTLEDRRFIHGTDGQTYWELDRYNPYTADARPTSMRRGHSITERKLDERLALAYLDHDGEVTGYGWEPKGGYHCTKSCWQSLKPKHY
jgi:hypothetical protein